MSITVFLMDPIMCRHTPVEKMMILDVITEEKPAATPFLTVRNRCKAGLYLALNPKTWM